MFERVLLSLVLNLMPMAMFDFLSANFLLIQAILPVTANSFFVQGSSNTRSMDSALAGNRF